MRGGVAVLVGGILIGIAFALFPFSGVAEAWAAENSTSPEGVYQIVAVIAIGVGAFAMLISGMWRSIPFPPVGFVLLVGGLMAVSWVGIGMLLGG